MTVRELSHVELYTKDKISRFITSSQSSATSGTVKRSV
ncbi:hypothetical protein ACVWXU_000013 [Streptomyces sp. TE33382]